jgi:hypothetical protein
MSVTGLEYGWSVLLNEEAANYLLNERQGFVQQEIDDETYEYLVQIAGYDSPFVLDDVLALTSKNYFFASDDSVSELLGENVKIDVEATVASNDSAEAGVAETNADLAALTADVSAGSTVVEDAPATENAPAKAPKGNTGRGK